MDERWKARWLAAARRSVEGARKAQELAHVEACERQAAAEAEFSARCWAAAVGHLLSAVAS